MRTITLLVASILLTTRVTIAQETRSFNHNTTASCNFDEPISFTERGIEFFVFTNGDFDFNTSPDDSQGDHHYRLAGKRTSEVNRTNPVNFGVLIEHDSFGRVRRVGNTFINYDSRDRVSRIGSVYMRYNRFALIQVGGMRIVYNRRGEVINMIGQVKRDSGFIYNNNATATTYGNGNNGNGNGYYHYRTDGTKALVEDDAAKEDKE
jgi:hypothetical protein